MKKNLIIITSIVVIIAVMSSVLLFLKNDEPQVIYTDDEIKFKDEYEKLNGTELSDNYILKAINIDSDNNVKYVSDDELLNVLTNGTNVIYFGWPDCNWCRTMLPILISTLKENNVDTLYYYNFKSLRTAYEENNDEKKVKLYEDIINIIGNDIETVFDEDSKRFLLNKGIDSNYGARPLRRLIIKEVEDKLSEEILQGNIQIGDQVRVNESENKLVFSKLS